MSRYAGTSDDLLCLRSKHYAQVYISKPDDYPQAPARLLLLLSSGTGIHSVNNQLQADAFAAEGFVVLMPDQ